MHFEASSAWLSFVQENRTAAATDEFGILNLCASLLMFVLIVVDFTESRPCPSFRGGLQDHFAVAPAGEYAEGRQTTTRQV